MFKKPEKSSCFFLKNIINSNQRTKYKNAKTNRTLKKFETDHLGASRALTLARCEKTIVRSFLKKTHLPIKTLYG